MLFNYKILRRCKMCQNCISNHFYWLFDILLMLNLVNYKVSKIFQVPARRPPSPGTGRVPAVEKHWLRAVVLNLLGFKSRSKTNFQVTVWSKWFKVLCPSNVCFIFHQNTKWMQILLELLFKYIFYWINSIIFVISCWN